MSDNVNLRGRVVENMHGCVSIWPTGRDIPTGWQNIGFADNREEFGRQVERVVRSSSHPRTGRADSRTLVDLFDATVERFAERTAVSHGEHALTYAELDSLSDALSLQLSDLGVQRGDHVAFYLDRGPHVFVSMLAVLKAGAAYVPVDTRYPAERRDMMISAAQTKVVISEPKLSGDLKDSGAAVHEIDQDSLSCAPRGRERLDGDDSAAVLFTSGSSGKPKATVLNHGNLVHFATNPSLPELKPEDRVGHVSSLSFDAFNFESWCAFAASAQVVIMPTIPDLLAGDLQRILRRLRVTAMLVPTMAVNHIVREDRDAFAPLRILHTGGDVLSPSAARELLAGKFTGVFSNLYGPTEATTACTLGRISMQDEDNKTVPIGSPLEGTEIYVLDHNLDEVSVGEVGECHIGGLGVAAGYFDDPVQTAEKFLPDPFVDDGARMYATGDLVRRRDDGQLEFIGRADDQVKIRGYRVEPREVERVLCTHPKVRDVAVVVTGETDSRFLRALVISDEELSMREVRVFAEEQLPDFMVPNSFNALQEVPVNDHGKRDNTELRLIASAHEERLNSHVDPIDDTERRIARIWEELLSAESVGMTDDFFLLGGNSLLAFRMQRKVAKDLSVEIKPRDVLVNSTLGALAKLVKERMEQQG